MRTSKRIKGKKVVVSIASLALVMMTIITTMTLPTQAAGVVARFTTKVTYFQDNAKEMFDMVNDFRTGDESWYWEYDDITKVECNDLEELEWNSELEKMAMERAKEAATFMSHTRPNGTLYVTIDPSGKVKSENLAWNSTDVTLMFNALKEDNKMSSGQGHRRTMLDKDFKYIGIGCAKVGGNICWAQVFSIKPPTSSVNFDTSSIQTLEVSKNYVNGIRATLIKTIKENQTFDVSDINIALITKSELGYSAYIILENPPITSVVSKDQSVLEVVGNKILAKRAGRTTLTVTSYGNTSDIVVDVIADTTNNTVVNKSENSFNVNSLYNNINITDSQKVNTQTQKENTDIQKVNDEKQDKDLKEEKTVVEKKKEEVKPEPTNRLTTTKRSKEEIKSYILSKGTTRTEMNKSNITYAKNTDQSAPYTQIGELSAQTKDDAMKLMNSIRYIAGLDADITFNTAQGRMAQAACVVNAANGSLSHYPKMPAGMDENTYSSGKTGASSSNLYSSSGMVTSLWASFVSGWMYDADSSNISKVGHRRWILNPVMGQTGFGAASIGGKFVSALYAFDKSNSAASQTNVAWPAENMPVEYFGKAVPWSISLGKTVDIEAASVKLIERNTGRTWNFSQSSADGYFNVDNGGYGLKGCVIFRPKDIDGYKNGDIFDVTVETAEFGTINYTVEFFDVTPPTTVNTQTVATSQFKQEAEGTIYRLYNASNGEHLYTTDVNEAKTLVTIGWKQEQSQGVSSSSGKAIYRLYNRNSGEHLYTADTNEVKVLTGMGWSQDNAGKPLFYGQDNGKTAVYRLYNPSLPQVASHHYTSDANEVRVLSGGSWRLENNGEPVYRLN